MKFKKLYDLCEYVNQKINSSSVNVSLYISTENMLPQKGGIVRAESIPINGKVNSFLEGDTLVSNIRPYFKKIWKASFSGACSNDVLIFRAKENVNKMFLYYLLSEDKFFDYSMASSKGTKMPRGDKKCLMEYEVPDYPRDYQDKIVKLLSSIDKKIEINNLINKNLSAYPTPNFETSISPDIKRGNRVSLIFSRFIFSKLLVRHILNKFGTISMNSCRSESFILGNSYFPTISADTRCRPLDPFMFFTA